jgi:hypothetical protein
VPHPRLPVLLAQRVEIEHGLPGGPGLSVLFQRGAAPDPAGVLRVLPEVVVLLAQLLDVRDPIVGLVDLQQLVVQLAVGSRAELALGVGVALGDPGEGALGLDLLEPGVGIGLLSPGQGAPIQQGTSEVGRLTAGAAVAPRQRRSYPNHP